MFETGRHFERHVIRRILGRRVSGREASRFAFDLLSISNLGFRPCFLYDTGTWTPKQISTLIDKIRPNLPSGSLPDLTIISNGKKDNFGMEITFVANTCLLHHFLSSHLKIRFASHAMVSVDSHLKTPRLTPQPSRNAIISALTVYTSSLIAELSAPNTKSVSPTPFTAICTHPLPDPKLTPTTQTGLLCGYPVVYVFEGGLESMEKGNCLGMEALLVHVVEWGKAKPKQVVSSFSLPESILSLIIQKEDDLRGGGQETKANANLQILHQLKSQQKSPKSLLTNILLPFLHPQDPKKPEKSSQTETKGGEDESATEDEERKKEEEKRNGKEGDDKREEGKEKFKPQGVKSKFKALLLQEVSLSIKKVSLARVGV
ncbi:hypothetical protein AAMO2058_000200400 [Amorphochlora amoebiformis]